MNRQGTQNSASNVIDKTVMKEAEEWFARLHSADSDAADTAAFAEWRIKDPQRGRAYRSVEALWDKTTPVSEDPQILELRRLALEATAGGGKRRHRLPQTRNWLWKSVAAAVVLGLGIVFGAVYFVPSSPQVLHYATAFGEQRTLRLEDGSAITLDSASRIDVALTEQQRVVQLLAGKARFDVARVAERPFVVMAADGLIRALGTAFDVSRDNDAVTVTLLEGKVEVVAEAGSPSTSVVTILAPGQQVVYSQKSGLSPVEAIDLDVATSWADGRLVFKGISLAKALDQVNHYARRKILLGDQHIGDKRFRGEFNIGDVQSVAKAIALMYPVKVIDSGSGDIVLVQKSAE